MMIYLFLHCRKIYHILVAKLAAGEGIINCYPQMQLDSLLLFKENYVT